MFHLKKKILSCLNKGFLTNTIYFFSPAPYKSAWRFAYFSPHILKRKLRIITADILSTDVNIYYSHWGKQSSQGCGSTPASVHYCDRNFQKPRWHMVVLRAQLCYSHSKMTPTTEKVISLYLPPYGAVIYPFTLWYLMWANLGGCRPPSCIASPVKWNTPFINPLSQQSGGESVMADRRALLIFMDWKLTNPS